MAGHPARRSLRSQPDGRPPRAVLASLAHVIALSACGRAYQCMGDYAASLNSAALGENTERRSSSSRHDEPAEARLELLAREPVQRLVRRRHLRQRGVRGRAGRRHCARPARVCATQCAAVVVQWRRRRTARRSLALLERAERAREPGEPLRRDDLERDRDGQTIEVVTDPLLLASRDDGQTIEEARSGLMCYAIATASPRPPDEAAIIRMRHVIESAVARRDPDP